MDLPVGLLMLRPTVQDAFARLALQGLRDILLSQPTHHAAVYPWGEIRINFQRSLGLRVKGAVCLRNIQLAYAQQGPLQLVGETAAVHLFASFSLG